MSENNETGVDYVGLPINDVRQEGRALINTTYEARYCDPDTGLAERAHVFLRTTKLAERLRRSTHITIAEIGFGTGLTFLAAMALRDSINPTCQIDYIAFESSPLSAEMIAHAHRPYDDISQASAKLCEALAPRWPGYHKVILDAGASHLHLYYGDAYKLITSCDFAADIWFLDGFAPAKNPSSWQPALLDEIYRCSASGAHLAAATDADRVRQNLAQSGFDTSSRHSRQDDSAIIVATKSGGDIPPLAIAPKSALIIGGGIAGASLSYALDKRGIKAVILEKGDSLAAGASGNGAAMQSARLRVHNDAAGRLSVACLSYARALADRADSIAHTGSVTITVRDKDQKRLDKLAQAGWPAALFQSLDAAACAEITGLNMMANGEYQPASAVIYPVKLTNYLAQSATVHTHCEVLSVRTGHQHYQISLADGRIFDADMVFVACGADIPEIMARSNLPKMAFQISAGQVSHWDAPTPLSDVRLGVNYGGYMTPPLNGRQYLGASFNRDGQSAVTTQGHQHNIDLLPKSLKNLAPDISQAKGRLSYRLSTKDRMPVCGAIYAEHDDTNPLYVIGALGARGMTNGPLLADMLVAQALGRPQGLDRAIIASLNPANVMF